MKTTVVDDKKFNEFMKMGLDFNLSEVIDWMVDKYKPAEIYSISDLESWANEEGWERPGKYEREQREL